MNAVRKRLWAFLKPEGGEWTKSVSTLLAVGGSLWVAWVFVFDKILVPAAAPVNVALQLDIKPLKTEAAKTNQDRIVVQLSATAKNSSNRVLTIRKTFWVAHARHLPASPDLISEDDMILDVNRQMGLGGDVLSLDGGASSRFQKSDDPWDVVAFGPLFDLNEIRPGEEIRTQRLIFLPAKHRIAKGEKSAGHAAGEGPDQPREEPYDVLRVKVIIPSYAKRSSIAEQDLIRVVGGFRNTSQDFVQVGFCRAERQFAKHGIHWFFDKFALPRDRFDDPAFREPAIHYCPNLMTPEEREKVGAQVFGSTYEIELNSKGQSDKP
jgi:hypothetical protein